MFKALRQWWGGGEPVSGPPRVKRVAVRMAWRQDARLPIPDWETIGANESVGRAPREVYWTSAAAHWLEAMSAALGANYRLRESSDFLLLSALPERSAQSFLSFCQGALRRLRHSLRELADSDGAGKHVVVVFADEDAYYDYISHYYADGGEYAMSSGVFLQEGYGHFALYEGAAEAMEPVIAHELTHCLLMHLPIPTWLNEGLAVNTERTLFPRLADPRAQLYSPQEIAEQHAGYWNEARIQAFWSGESFARADEGNRLSYDLAAKMTALAARDEAAFRAFVADAHMDDGGAGAEHHLGYPVAHLAEAVLGQAVSPPCPDQWPHDPAPDESP